MYICIQLKYKNIGNYFKYDLFKNDTADIKNIIFFSENIKPILFIHQILFIHTEI